MKILIVSSKKNEYEVSKIQSSFMNNGLECVIETAESLSVVIAKNMEPLTRWNSDFSFIIFRNTAGNKWNFVRTIRATLLESSVEFTQKVLNGQCYRSFPVFSKITQISILNVNGIYTPKTVYLDKDKYVHFGFPCIVKPNYGSKGKNVYLVNNKEQLGSVIKHKKITELIIQEYLPGESDYRAVVIGKEVAAVYKRTAKPGEFLTNYSAGGQIINCEPAILPEIEQLALKTASILKCEFCGVDIRRDKFGKFVVIEINRSAGFKGVEKTLGIPISRYLTKYISEKLQLLH